MFTKILKTVRSDVTTLSSQPLTDQISVSANEKGGKLKVNRRAAISGDKLRQIEVKKKRVLSTRAKLSSCKS